MEALENIMTRTSLRKFDTERPVTQNDLDAILRAGMSAPSAVNRQPWHFVVVSNREKLDALAAGLPYCQAAKTAPVAIVVCGAKERFLGGVDDELWVQDVSAASENVLLAINALGLGGVWTSVYPHADRIAVVRNVLDLPDNLVPFNVIPLGYPTSRHAPLKKWHPERVTYIR